MNDLEKLLDINANIWINANAGSGKTTMLIKRLLYTIIKQGNPEKILIISYTKVAAQEILERVFQIINKLKDKTDEEREVVLKSYMMDNLFSKKEIDTAIEKIFWSKNSATISTIHSLCSKIISKSKDTKQSFQKSSELNAYKEDDLKKKVYAIVSKKIKNDYYNGTKESKMMINLLSKKDISDIIDKAIGELYILTEGKPQAKSIIKENNISYDSIVKSIESLFNTNILEDILSNEQAGSMLKKSANKAKKSSDPIASIASFLTAEKSLYKSLITTKLSKNCPSFVAELASFLDKILQIYEKYEEWLNYQVNKYVTFIVNDAIGTYAKLKKEINLYDYSDLLLEARSIIKNNLEIRRRLYENIDHIFIDEAQDTNIISWDIIFSITEDFFVGYGSNNIQKTIFIVGDEKQCIYGFQGADINIFKRIKEQIQEKSINNNITFHNIDLSVSYRSSQVILDFVDEIMNKYMLNDNKIKHISAKGIIDNTSGVFTHQLKIDKKEAEITWRPNFVNKPDELSIKCINKLINIIESEKELGVEEKDIMVLVFNRTAKKNFLIEAIEECKKRGLNTSGLDRFYLNRNIIYHDFESFLLFLLNPQDNINTAKLLRSVFVNCSLKDLEQASLNKKDISLYDYLRQNNSLYYNKLQLFLSNYKNYGIIKTSLLLLKEPEFRDNINNKYEKSGIQVIDKIASIILESNENSISNMLLLLKYNHVIKNNDKKGIKFTTVHSSKGLEAKVVIIIDLDRNLQMNTSRKRDKLHINNEFDLLYLCMIMKDKKDISEIIKTVDIRANMEKLRSIYVALTRSINKLHIIGQDINKEEDEFWKKNLFTLCDEINKRLGENR